ncbi:MAG: hypothetical protein JO061_06600, partial [Acidobacteriaceae bacterium]|nr:hypothetical protein [Acidobacteriaceae bacterium]
MEPLNDRELDELLSRWQAPSAPGTLERRLTQACLTPWWRWLLTGTVRVPVPLTLLSIAAFIAMFAIAIYRGPQNHGRTASVGEFRPVKEVQVQIIRSSYE